MEIGMLIRFGKLVPGRERKAIDLFAEALEYWGEKLSSGAITFFEPYFFATSDVDEETGFMLIKGPAPELFKIIEEEAFLSLNTKAAYFTDHFRWDLLTVGEGVQDQVVRAGKVLADVGV